MACDRIRALYTDTEPTMASNASFPGKLAIRRYRNILTSDMEMALVSLTVSI